jgi:hypothetical protein
MLYLRCRSRHDEGDEVPSVHMNMLTLARSGEIEIDFRNIKSCASVYYDFEENKRRREPSLQKAHQPHQGVLVMGAPRRASFSRPSVSGQGLVRAAKLLSSR